ncbi:MAG: peptide deformylase [Phycisphaerales bacterium]|jgi:peptide deformylase|nr:peptide deformylase [Phycisphaerales bacterium]MBT7171559.1 peptide deformylase [Phycisphaerales bacterium]
MTGNQIISATTIASLHLVKWPDKRLLADSVRIDTVDESVIQLVERMAELMFEHRGVGLAAPQVGLNVRLFIACPTFEPDDVRAYINPVIVEADGSQSDEEGCLSFPDIFGQVKRAEHIVVEAMDLNGELFREDCTELHARIIQHEIDHLDGVILLDKLSMLAKMKFRKQIAALQQEA